jgi:hypothetical protein
LHEEIPDWFGFIFVPFLLALAHSLFGFGI